MARFYCLTPLERRIAETLVEQSRSTVMKQYRFNASQVQEALNGSGAGVSEHDIDDILGRLGAAGIITLQAETPRIYSLAENNGDFAIKAVLDNGVWITAPRETKVLHRVEAEMLHRVLEHEHFDATSIDKAMAPFKASEKDGVRPLKAFIAWLTEHFLIQRPEMDGATFSPFFPPFWCKSAPWVTRVGARDEGVTVDRLFRLTPDELDQLHLVVQKVKTDGGIQYPGHWLNQVFGDEESGRKWYHIFIGALRPLMHITGNGVWKLSPEFARYRFVVMEPFGTRFKSHVEDLPESYTAHPDHAYWQIKVLAGYVTEQEAERAMGTKSSVKPARRRAAPVPAVPAATAPEPPAEPPAPEPVPAPPSPPEFAPAAPAAAVPPVSDAVREDAEASRERVSNRKDEYTYVLSDWQSACEVHAVELETLRMDVERLRADLARKEAELGTLEASKPARPPEIALRQTELKDAICRHNMAYGDVLLLDNTGAHIELPIPVVAPPAASSPPSSSPAAPATPAASGGNGSAAAPHSGNGMTEWNESAKDAFVESVLAVGVARRQEVVGAFIAAHPAFKPMSVRAVASRMTGGFQDWFCKSYLEGRTGSDRTRAIHRLATFYKASPADITRLVGPAR